MEQFWQCILDLSANHVSRHGFYIPGGQYTLVQWNELVAVILLFIVVMQAFHVKRLKNMLACARKRNEREPEPAVTPLVAAVREPVYMNVQSVLARLAEIMERGGSVRIRYADEDGVVTDRVIEPVRAYSSQGCYYIEAYCRLRDEERTFRLDRIIDVRSAEEYDVHDILDDNGTGILRDMESIIHTSASY